jgi:hypothetical protein
MFPASGSSTGNVDLDGNADTEGSRTDADAQLAPAGDQPAPQPVTLASVSRSHRGPLGLRASLTPAWVDVAVVELQGIGRGTPEQERKSVLVTHGVGLPHG